MPLKSAMSEKNTVSVRRSAWSAPLPMSWLMRRGSTNLPNVSLMRSRERSSSTMLLNDRASSPTSSRVRMTTGAEFVPDAMARALATSWRSPLTAWAEPTALMPRPMPQAAMNRAKLR